MSFRGLTRQTALQLLRTRAGIAFLEDCRRRSVPLERAARQITDGAPSWAEFAGHARSGRMSGYMGQRTYILCAAARELTRGEG